MNGAVFIFYTQLTADNVFDVLCVADMYLLPGLKRICGKSLAQAVCKDNVVQMWKVAKLFQLSRLEDYCTEYMAKFIDQVRESVVTPGGSCLHDNFEKKHKCTWLTVHFSL